jgi:hypothetical protein
VRWLVTILLGVLLLGCAAQGRRTTPSVLPAKPRHIHRPAPAPRPARPPQFVVASFDGSGGAQLWRYWRAVAKHAHAHFTFFVSGVYLIDWDQHDLYSPPGLPRGESSIGFAPDAAWRDGTRSELALGYREGNEIGSHYNGHFCGPGGVGTWSAADWGHELDQFDHLVFDRGGKLPFGPGEVVGERTPCLEGNLGVLYPVLAKRGFLYDTSRVARLGTWPSRIGGLWSVPLLELPFIGHTFRVVSMDYNFMANQIDESPAQIENEMYRTLWNAFRASYLGNRAPLQLGNHFETWESWAYDHALTRFLVRACRMPEVRCTTIHTLVNWLEAQSPKRLGRFRLGRFPHARPARLNPT